jgi:hypothetical protein
MPCAQAALQGVLGGRSPPSGSLQGVWGAQPPWGVLKGGTAPLVRGFLRGARPPFGSLQGVSKGGRGPPLGSWTDVDFLMY